MTVKHQKAIVINHWWAGILAFLLSSCIIGGVTFAWDTNAAIAVIQSQNDKTVPQRLAVIETKLDMIMHALKMDRGVAWKQ